MGKALDNIVSRRSVRSFRNEQLQKSALDDILIAGLSAPSARNTQNWQLTVVQDRARLEQLRAVVAAALDNPDYHRFYNAPTLVIVSTPSDYEFGAFDSSVVLQNIFLAAHELGIGSVWINQLVNISDRPDVRKVLTTLKIPENHRTWGSAALGYPDGEVKQGRENKGTVVYV